MDRAITLKKDIDKIRYTAKRGRQEIGWLTYNRATSTIENIYIHNGFEGQGLEQAIMDRLIEKETLVSAEIAYDDKNTYKWMLQYGFRPARTFDKNGVKTVKMELSTAVLLKKLKGKRPARPYRKQEVVAIERIPEGMSYEDIKEGIKNIINNLGGLERFVRKGQTVVIKPNIVSDHGLKDGVYKGGIITDIRVIRALIEILLPVAKRVIVAEGSSINRSSTGQMFSHYGYDRLRDLDPDKVSLVDLNNDDLIERTVPEGKRMASRKIPMTLERADVIINVPVLKIHFAAIVSLSIKSLQGAVPPLEKYMTHFFGLWQNLVNIHYIIKPKLTIIDGLVGQEDFGPVSGTPKKMGILLGATNPVALDAVAMRIMGIDPLSSPPVFLAYMQGMGPVEQDKIKILGTSIEEVASPFKQPLIDLSGGRDFNVHDGDACSGCRGYLHFVLAKLRRPDPAEPDRLLIDRPLDKKAHVFLGPQTPYPIDSSQTNIFMGICQQHNAQSGIHLPGCPPHAEVIVNGIFNLFPDVERPKYADESEEKKLGEMLKQILNVI
ncbi:MAG TPA: DUF362 domain-containing protein [Syntrophorhabdaceae bacterium]|nr:DUF362 domain-containing protein [Syntrophorhabdaceae bacterium]HOT41198.1 DUF362 domain-containing protein [Syntrophorhabdaceae bacterium]HPC65739.1 DUF362 domain-containing protein [Syntrophorhabdaceae bacterium]HQH42498.1 DUF362 domain-containing protein [Syntrophorhabdaceae bacterium]HQK45729.1 DUF362 domain-containing protein [Syntrophorhabdaceae bacterium]